MFRSMVLLKLLTVASSKRVRENYYLPVSLQVNTGGKSIANNLIMKNNNLFRM